jgi:LuxR family maltose regulon positive regulatory protein
MRAAPFTEHVLGGAGAGLDLLFAAEAAYNRAQFPQAEQFAQRSMLRAQPFSQHTIELDAQFVLIRLLTARGDIAEAEMILVELWEKLSKQEDLLLSTMLTIMDSWFRMVTGRPEEVADWIIEGRFDGSAILGIGSWFEQYIHARLLLYENRIFELEAFLPVLNHICNARRNVVDNRIEFNILQSFLKDALGDVGEAGAAIRRAYLLAYGNSIVMPFVTYGNRMQRLLRVVESLPDCPVPSDWIAEISVAAGNFEKMTTRGKRGGGAKKLGISPKELEVLALLSQSMANKEIAEKLNMTVATVKWYVNQIMSKLGAENRTKAAMEAIRLGLLDG